jgi:hypothetical protein
VKAIYADTGLINNQGHHANSCRNICRELRLRGVKVMVVGYANIENELKNELDATPLFRHYTYQFTDGDPVCGLLNGFEICWRGTLEDLQRLPALDRHDLMYLNSAQPAQFMALVQWWKAIPEPSRPCVVMEFGTDPGVDVLEAATDRRLTFSLRDYRNDARAMFYRFAARHLSTKDLERFHLVTFDETSSRVFSGVIDRPVGVLPFPQNAQSPVVSRVGRRPITVAVLGHQRLDKGYQLMPEIVRHLLATENGIRLLIHNSAPEDMPKTQEELRAIAAVEPRLVVDEQAVEAVRWSQLLSRSDLILCPYDPARYMASYSAITTDAVANAIPLVVPARTSMAQLIASYGGTGTTFKSQVVGDVVAATREAIAEFDTLAMRAVGAASRWMATMGASNTAEMILSRCAAR